VEVVEAVLDLYKTERHAGEAFIDTLQRLGPDPFKTVANQARHVTRQPQAASDQALPV